MESAGNVGLSDLERGGSMATKSTPRKSGDEAPAPKKVRPKKAQLKGAGSDGPTAPAAAAPKEVVTPPQASTPPRFNATTIKAMQDAKAGTNLTRYRDEDDLFQKLGIKLGQAKARTKTQG
jgi:hypothetical protein